jgi:hypothetical protein
MGSNYFHLVGGAGEGTDRPWPGLGLKYLRRQLGEKKRENIKYRKKTHVNGLQ